MNVIARMPRKMTMLPPDPKFLIRHNSSITCLAFSSNKPLLYSGSVNGEVKIWNLQTYRSKDSISSSTESVLSIHAMEREADDDLLIQDKMGAIILWTKTSGDWVQIWMYKVDYMGFCQSRVMDDTILSPLSNSGIQFNSVSTGQKIKTLTLLSKDLAGELMTILPYTRNNEKFILTGTEAGNISVWDWCGTACGTPLKLEDCVMTIAFDPIRMRGAAAGPTGTITTFNVTSNGIRLAKLVQLQSKGVAALALRPDTKLLAIACWDGKLRLLSWKSLVSLALLTSHDESLQTVAFSNKSPYLFAGGCKNGIISIWDLYNSTPR